MKICVPHTARPTGPMRLAFSETCPIATAIKEATGEPIVYAFYLEIVIGPLRLQNKRCWKTPRDIADRMRRYDKTGRMEAFEFELPDELLAT